MHDQRVRSIFAAAALAGLFGAAPQAARCQEKTAEQVFKNIVVLKGTPADQLMPAMQFVAASLGVNCEFCHVRGQMDSDEKGPKKTARAMMVMQAAINKDNFRGRLQITCYSCHRGATHPVNMPPVLESDARPDTEAAPRRRHLADHGGRDRGKVRRGSRRSGRDSQGYQPHREGQDHRGRQ